MKEPKVKTITLPIETYKKLSELKMQLLEKNNYEQNVYYHQIIDEAVKIYRGKLDEEHRKKTDSNTLF